MEAAGRRLGGGPFAPGRRAAGPPGRRNVLTYKALTKPWKMKFHVINWLSVT